MIVRKIATAMALLSLATLGGCDWFKPAPPPETSNTVESENVVAPAEPATPAPLNIAAPTEANAAAPAAADLREAPPPPDAQTQDDADAVGMTSHVRRDETVSNTTP